MKSFLGRVVHFHMKFFQYIGYQTISLEVNPLRRKRTEKFLIAWTILLLLSYCSLTLHTFLSEDEFLYTGDAFGYFNDCLKLTIAQSALIISYLETIFRRREMLDFWQQYMRLHKQTHSNSWKRELHVHFRFLYIFYGILTAELFCEGVFFTFNRKLQHHIFLFWSMFTPYIFAVRFRNMQFIFHMECMRLELKQLECELSLLAEYTSFAARVHVFEGFEEFVREKLVKLQLSYERIHDMFWNFKKTFSFSIVLVLLMEYVRVLVDAYFIYYTLFRGWDPLGQPGVATFNEEMFWSLWTLILLVLFKALAITALVNRSVFLYTKDGFGFFVDSIKLIVTSLTLDITLCEPLWHRAQIKQFWTLYARLIRQRGLERLPLSQQIREYRRFLGWFYGFSLFSLFFELFFGMHLSESSKLVSCFWMMFMPYVYALRFRDLNFQFHMELVRKELMHLEKELSLLVVYTEFGHERHAFGRFDDFMREALLEKQKVYMRIYEMVECLKCSSGYSMIATYMKAYIRIVVDFYWVFWAFYQNLADIKDILLIPALFEIPMLLITSKNCMNAVKYITLQLHNIKHSVDNVQLSVQIQNFSLQLLHQNIRIDAVGITVMDGYMLSRAIGSITTYMIFFIQFMPKFPKNLK